MVAGPGVERLGPDACWSLLDACALGRLCFTVAEVTQIRLTGYLVADHTLYFRSSAFGSVARLVESRPVTLQIDDLQAHQQATWSVTVTGPAHRVHDTATLASLWRPVRPAACEYGTEMVWIALEPCEISGQRVRL